MPRKIATIALYVIAIILLGAIAGAFCWVFFFVMNNGINIIWKKIPAAIAGSFAINSTALWWWPIPICLLGGICVGLFQSRWPGQPEEMNEVLAKVRQTKRYEYKNIFVDFSGALIALLFGGSIGPEAGLTGVIAGACTWVGDRLRFLGKQFQELAQIGLSAVIGAMFNAPLYGLATPIFGDGESVADVSGLVPKPAKIAIYILAVASAIAALEGLGALFGSAGGLPRFSELNVSANDWIWLVPLALAGAIVGWLFHAAGFLARTAAAKIGNHPIAKGILAGIALGVIGSVLPYTMFAGEAQAEELKEVWTSLGIATLIATAFVKPFVLQFCLNFGWRGGKFFPMIFCGVSLGYAASALTGIDPVFCLCVCTSGALGTMLRQPLMAILLLLLCFPVRGIVFMLIATLIGAAIPVPKRWQD